MKNRELIEQLNKLPLDLDVAVWLPESGVALIVNACESCIYENGAARPAIGLVTNLEPETK